MGTGSGSPVIIDSSTSDAPRTTVPSVGTCRADGSVVGFETEATAIYDTMNSVGSDVCTVPVKSTEMSRWAALEPGSGGAEYSCEHAGLGPGELAGT